MDQLRNYGRFRDHRHVGDFGNRDQTLRSTRFLGMDQHHGGAISRLSMCWGRFRQQRYTFAGFHFGAVAARNTCLSLR